MKTRHAAALALASLIVIGLVVFRAVLHPAADPQSAVGVEPGRGSPTASAPPAPLRPGDAPAVTEVRASLSAPGRLVVLVRAEGVIAPIPIVSLSPPGAEALSASGKRVAFDVPGGVECALTVRADGWREWSGTVRAPSGAERTIDVELEPLHRVTGHVVRAGSLEPVPGASVSVRVGAAPGDPLAEFEIESAARADDDGAFRVQGLSARFSSWIVFRADDAGERSAESAPLRLYEGIDVSGVRLVLPERGGSRAFVEGRVRDVQGAPVAGAWIGWREGVHGFGGAFLHADEPHFIGSPRADQGAPTRSDAGGAFRLSIPAGVEGRWLVHHPAFVPHAAPPETLAAGTHVREVVLTEGGSIEGRVLADDDFLERHGVTDVEVHAADGSVRRAALGAARVFRVAGLEAGVHVVVVPSAVSEAGTWIELARRPVALAEGAVEWIDVALGAKREGGVLVGALRGLPSGPAEAFVAVMGADLGGRPLGVTTADDDGAFELTGLPDGEWNWIATAKSERSDWVYLGSGRVRIHADRRNELAIDGSSSVVRFAGFPAGAELSVEARSGDPLVARALADVALVADESGDARWFGLADGEYTVRWSEEGLAEALARGFRVAQGGALIAR